MESCIQTVKGMKLAAGYWRRWQLGTGYWQLATSYL
jgi:hypothetical protein